MRGRGHVLTALAPVLMAAALGTPQRHARPHVRLAHSSVTWHPERPVQGSLVLITVRTDSLAPSLLWGTAAAEPLHFESMAGGAGSWALVPVPLDSGDSLAVWIAFERDSAATSPLSVLMPIAPLTFESERLKPPPQFRRLPDSSVVARAAAESEEVEVALLHSHLRPRLWTAAFRRPVPGSVRSAFGASRTFAKGMVRRHRGADLAGAKGQPVRAANRGIVALVGDHYYGGLTVLIDHGAGLVTTYEHLSRADVVVGDTVARGAVIGRVGATGRATGPHLHWAAYYGRVAVDPLQLLTLTSP